MKEKNILTVIADNPELFSAVKEMLLSGFSIDKIDRKASDEMLGQLVRARLVGIEVVEDIFATILAFQSTKEKTQTENPGY